MPIQVVAIELAAVILWDGVEEGRSFSNEEKDPITFKELNEPAFTKPFSYTFSEISIECLQLKYLKNKVENKYHKLLKSA